MTFETLVLFFQKSTPPVLFGELGLDWALGAAKKF
jgi:hypothetical protein